jgi:hypothetical protein
LRRICAYEQTQFDKFFHTLLTENRVTRPYINLEIENAHDILHTVSLSPLARVGDLTKDKLKHFEIKATENIGMPTARVTFDASLRPRSLRSVLACLN